MKEKNKNLFKIWSSGVLITLSLFALDCDPAYAQQSGVRIAQQSSSSTQSGSTVDCGPNFKYENGTCMPDPLVRGGFAEKTTLLELILEVIKYALYLAGIIAVIFIIIGGYQYLTSGGNDEQAEKGRKTLVNAVIGIAVVIMAFTIVTIITNLITGNETGVTAGGANSNPNNVRYNRDDPRSIAP